MVGNNLLPQTYTQKSHDTVLLLCT